MKNIKPFLDRDPLTLSHEKFNNNDMKTEQSYQESEEKIKSEKIDSDLEIKNDVNDFNDFKTELADDESEEIPILEVRIKNLKKKKKKRHNKRQQVQAAKIREKNSTYIQTGKDNKM